MGLIDRNEVHRKIFPGWTCEEPTSSVHNTLMKRCVWGRGGRGCLYAGYAKG